MYKGKYVLGICMTKMYDVHNKRYLECLREEAAKENMQIMVFHSFYDFFYDVASDHGAAAVFSLINYDIVDVLVVLPDNFKTQSFIDAIIAEARKYEKPVISIDRELPVDVCIMPDQGKAFSDLIRHLFDVHRIKRPYYMSGIKGSEDSEKREEAYRAVLKEYDTEVCEKDYMGYGEFWSEPTKRELERFFNSGNKLPDAFICANDSMAVTVCEYLTDKGLSVPEDVIVTGYDGIDPDDLMVPAITTCENDYKTYAEHTIDSAIRLIDKGKTYSLWHVPLKLKLTESCGCKKHDYKRYAENASMLYNMAANIDHLDFHWLKMPSRIIEDTSLTNVKKVMKYYLPDNSAVCVTMDMVQGEVSEIKAGLHFPEQMVTVVGKDKRGNEFPMIQFETKDIIPEFQNHSWGNTLVFTALHSEDKAFGYVVSDMNELTGNTRDLHRFVMLLDSTMGLIDESSRVKGRGHLEELKNIDSATGLLSYRGLHKEIEKQFGEEIGDDRLIAVSMYSITNWKEANKDYGDETSDFALNLVKDCLIAATDGEYLLSRFAEGNFILVESFGKGAEADGQINKNVDAFFENLKKANEAGRVPFEVKVGAGSTVSDENWKGSVSDFVYIASNELIAKGLRGNVVLHENMNPATEEVKKKVKMLIESNLFNYHFQPIVDVRDGSIYAYEALMRTPSEIGLSPDDVLNTAEELGRLYDIEKATVSNVYEIFSKRREAFGGRKVFINSIPGITIRQSDLNDLRQKYPGVDENIVIEVTERRRYGSKNLSGAIENRHWQYAIDDYGVRSSELAGLMRFDPKLIKIDRFLIFDIDRDVNKQMFVRNIMDFAKNNGMKVIAEGVENFAELATVIGYGVNLVQGYYTAKPDAEIKSEIDAGIRRNILSAASEEL